MQGQSARQSAMSVQAVCVVTVLAVVGAPVTAWTSRPAPYTVRPIEELAREMGYEVERHNITTADGYILTYHRVPRGRNFNRNYKVPRNRKVLLLNNGILLSSAAVLANRRDWAYEFADAGFDVWLGNYRGNTYSRRHTHLDPDRDKQFWDYSLHELGTQDLPASIDYILGVTGASQLLYVGISMGTTMFWVLGSALPQYMDKIEAMVAIAPVARTSHASLLNSPFRRNNAQTVLSAVEAMGYREVLRYDERTASMIHAGCTRSLIWRPLCLLLYNTFQYLTRNNWDVDRVFQGVKYSPAGIATKVLRHYIQIAKAHTFQHFDYGPAGNRLRYQTDHPPEYDLRNVNCSRIYFITSEADLVADKEDVQWLSERLPTRPTRILGDQGRIQRLSHLGVGLDKRVVDIVITPLAAFLRRRHSSALP